MMTDKPTRLHHAVVVAQEKFWESMVNSYPEIVSGDTSPDAAISFDGACMTAAAAWVESNRPDKEDHDKGE